MRLLETLPVSEYFGIMLRRVFINFDTAPKNYKLIRLQLVSVNS